jgi:cytochrome c1
MTEDKKVKKVGIKEITREGFEYEITVNFNIDRDTHKAMPSKDNTRLFEGKDPFVITAETGKQLINWMKSGKKVKAVSKKKEPEVVPVTKADVVAYLTEAGIAKKDMAAYILEKTGLDAKTAEPAEVLAALKKAK